MAEPTEEVPLIIIKPDKMLNSWSTTFKISILLALSIVVYGYLYILARTVYLKSKRLDRIGIMDMETQKMMQNLYMIDHNMSMDLEDLYEFYSDY